MTIKYIGGKWETLAKIIIQKNTHTHTSESKCNNIIHTNNNE